LRIALQGHGARSIDKISKRGYRIEKTHMLRRKKNAAMLSFF